MRKIKGFSYDEERDKEVIEHINRQQNGSKYIWDLVRKDMETGNLDDYIKNQVEEYLKDVAEKVKNPNRT